MNVTYHQSLTLSYSNFQQTSSPPSRAGIGRWAGFDVYLIVFYLPRVDRCPTLQGSTHFLPLQLVFKLLPLGY